MADVEFFGSEYRLGVSNYAGRSLAHELAGHVEHSAESATRTTIATAATASAHL